MEFEIWGLHTYHLVIKGQGKTICGRPIDNMEYISSDIEDTECLQCLAILKRRKARLSMIKPLGG